MPRPRRNTNLAVRMTIFVAPETQDLLLRQAEARECSVGAFLDKMVPKVPMPAPQKT